MFLQPSENTLLKLCRSRSAFPATIHVPELIDVALYPLGSVLSGCAIDFHALYLNPVVSNQAMDDITAPASEAEVFRLRAQLAAAENRENHLIELVREQCATIEDLQAKVGELNLMAVMGDLQASACAEKTPSRKSALRADHPHRSRLDHGSASTTASEESLHQSMKRLRLA